MTSCNLQAADKPSEREELNYDLPGKVRPDPAALITPCKEREEVSYTRCADPWYDLANPVPLTGITHAYDSLRRHEALKYLINLGGNYEET